MKQSYFHNEQPKRNQLLNDNGEIDQNKFETILNKKQYLSAINQGQFDNSSLQTTIQARSTKNQLTKIDELAGTFLNPDGSMTHTNRSRMEIKIKQHTLPVHNRSQSNTIAFGAGDILGKTFSRDPVANQPGYGVKPDTKTEEVSYKQLMYSLNRERPGGKGIGKRTIDVESDGEEYPDYSQSPFVSISPRRKNQNLGFGTERSSTVIQDMTTPGTQRTIPNRRKQMEQVQLKAIMGKLANMNHSSSIHNGVQLDGSQIRERLEMTKKNLKNSQAGNFVKKQGMKGGS